MITLSAGQQRVRQLAQQLLDKNAYATLSEQKWLQGELMKQLVNDPVIASDPVTGCQVGYLEIAKTYATWLEKENGKNYLFQKWLESHSNSIECNFWGHWVILGMVHLQEPLYKGGGKPDSAAYAILYLQIEKAHSLKCMSVKHFCNSGLTIIHTGNHRMAGYKLSGRVNFPKDIVTVYNDSFDEILNQYLIRLETLFPDLTLTGLDNLPAIQPLSALTSFYETHPDLVEAIEEIRENTKTNFDSKAETLIDLNKGVTAYKTITASSPRSILEKLFSSKKADEPLYQQLLNWLHTTGVGYPYPDLSDSTHQISPRTNSI